MRKSEVIGIMYKNGCELVLFHTLTDNMSITELLQHFREYHFDDYTRIKELQDESCTQNS